MGEARAGQGEEWPAPSSLAPCSQPGAQSGGASGRQQNALSTQISVRLWGNVLVCLGPVLLAHSLGPCFSEAPRILLSSPTGLMECERGEQPRLKPHLQLFCNHTGPRKAPHASRPRHPRPGRVSPSVSGHMCAVCPGCICNELIRMLFSNSPLMSKQPPKPACFLSFEAGQRVLPEVDETP